MAAHVRELLVDVCGRTVHCPVIRLVDRRSKRPRSKEWLLIRSVELILFRTTEVRPALAFFCVSPLPSATPS